MFNMFTALDGVLLEEDYCLYPRCKSDGVQMHDKQANKRPLMLVLAVPEEVLP